MPKSLVERLSWLVLFVAMAAVAVFFFRSEKARRASLSAAAGLSGQPTAPAGDLILDRQVPDFRLTNQLAAPVTRESLAGVVWVVNVIFSRCPGQCHQLSQQMRKVQDGLPVGAPVRLLSLTADPEYDSPAVLNRYGNRYANNPATWLFLTGPKPEVYGLATTGLLFSVVEQPEDKRATLNDLFIHSTAFALVDRRAHLRGVVQGEMTNAVEKILNHVDRLLREP